MDSGTMLTPCPIAADIAAVTTLVVGSESFGVNPADSHQAMVWETVSYTHLTLPTNREV